MRTLISFFFLSLPFDPSPSLSLIQVELSPYTIEKWLKFLRCLMAWSICEKRKQLILHNQAMMDFGLLPMVDDRSNQHYETSKMAIWTTQTWHNEAKTLAEWTDHETKKRNAVVSPLSINPSILIVVEGNRKILFVAHVELGGGGGGGVGVWGRRII